MRRYRLSKMTEEELRKVLEDNISNIVVKPDFLNSGVFAKNKNVAFAMIKEFFVKHAAEEITSERLSDMLSDDCNSMFSNIKHRTEKNYEALTQVRQGRMTD